MNIRDLLTRLLGRTYRLEDEVKIVIYDRDENGCVISKKSARINYVRSGEIVIESKHITEEYGESKE